MSTFTNSMIQDLFKTSTDVLKIKEGIVNFEKNVFSYSKDKRFDDVRSVELPSTIAEVGEIVLADFTSLKNIVVNPDNSKFKSINGVLYSKDGKRLIKFPSGRKGKFIVPDEVEIIENAAFYLSEIEEVILPPNLKKISTEAFYQCDKLSKIEIPDTVEIIDDEAFYMCEMEEPIKLPKRLEKIGVLAFSTPVQIEENDIYETDSSGILYNKKTNSIELITSESESISLCGDFEVKSYSGVNQTIVQLNGNMYVREHAFSNCENLEIIGYPYIERLAFNSNLKRIIINGEVLQLDESMQLIDFFSFRDRYIIEYYTQNGFRIRTIKRKEYSELPEFDEVRNYTRCRNEFWPVTILEELNDAYNNDRLEFTEKEQLELDILIENCGILELEEFKRIIRLIEKARYVTNDFFGIENNDSGNGIKPIKGNKYFLFIVNQILNEKSFLNTNKEEFLDFLYDFFEEYTYELTGKTTTIAILDVLGGLKGEYDLADDEVFINKSTIRRYKLLDHFFTIYHEAGHTEQDREMRNSIMYYKHYLMIKEKMLEEYYSDNEENKKPREVITFYDENYEIELSELDADNGAIELYRKSLELWGFSKERTNEIISQIKDRFEVEQEDRIEAKSENKYFMNSRIDINELFEKALPSMLKEQNDIFEENEILLIEFNEDGTPKNKIEILKGFEKFISDDNFDSEEKLKGLDLYFGILLKDNRLPSKEEIIRNIKDFLAYQTDNDLVNKMRVAYIEKMERMMRSILTNQLQQITRSQMSDEGNASAWEYKLKTQRQKIRFKQMNDINQRIQTIKEEFSFEEECK